MLVISGEKREKIMYAPDLQPKVSVNEHSWPSLCESEVAQISNDNVKGVGNTPKQKIKLRRKHLGIRDKFEFSL